MCAQMKKEPEYIVQLNTFGSYVLRQMIQLLVGSYLYTKIL